MSTLSVWILQLKVFRQEMWYYAIETVLVRVRDIWESNWRIGQFLCAYSPLLTIMVPDTQCVFLSQSLTIVTYYVNSLSLMLKLMIQWSHDYRLWDCTVHGKNNLVPKNPPTFSKHIFMLYNILSHTFSPFEHIESDVNILM